MPCPALPVCSLQGATSANHCHCSGFPLWCTVIYFMLVTAGCCSGCTLCITLHDLHSASFDYRRQRRGSGRSDDHAVQEALQRFSRTSDGVSVYGSEHNEWCKVWFKWASPDPSNCSPLSVITTFCALCLGLHTDKSYQSCCFSSFLCLYEFSCEDCSRTNIFPHVVIRQFCPVKGHIWRSA